MSPDIEWRIGEEAEEDSVIAATPRKPGQWRALWVILSVCLGIGLGITYRSIPEPPPRPTPLPMGIQPARPSDTPPSFDPSVRLRLLQETIAREIDALADGDLDAFAAVQDQSDVRWAALQRANFQVWGRPSAAAERPGALFFYSMAPGSLQTGDVWLDITQYRAGVYWRETRFYRWQADRWVRVQPADGAWCCQLDQFSTSHFRLAILEFDRVFAQTILDRFETVYALLCADLACPSAASVPRIDVIVRPDFDHAGQLMLSPSPTIMLPSPRVTGLRLSATDFDRGDPMTNIALHRLPEIVVRDAAGGSARWAASQQGALFLAAVAYWEQNRHLLNTSPADLIQPDLLQRGKLTLPRYLWDWPVRDSRRLAAPQAQANSVVVYIDQTYGPYGVVRFLKAIGSAPSLPQAIEESLLIGYNEFEKEWQSWLAQQLRQ